jgi:hypothetical protein
MQVTKSRLGALIGVAVIGVVLGANRLPPAVSLLCWAQIP